MNPRRCNGIGARRRWVMSSLKMILPTTTRLVTVCNPMRLKLRNGTAVQRGAGMKELRYSWHTSTRPAPVLREIQRRLSNGIERQHEKAIWMP